MAELAQQIQAARIPSDLRNGPPDQLDAHIRGNIVKPLDSLPQQKLSSTDPSLDLLSLLDPFQDSLAYLYILVAQINAIGAKSKSTPLQFMPGGELWQKIARFTSKFDSLQIRYGGNHWLHLVDTLVKMAHLGRSGSVGATTMLAQAMLRLDPTCGTFTSTHLDLLRKCIETGNYSDAVPVLDRDIHSLPRKHMEIFPCAEHHLSSGYLTLDSDLTAKVTRNDVLEYYLLGGMAYIGLRQWDRARHSLDFVLCTPTSSNSGPATWSMVEAYKKWILVGLMMKTKPRGLPKAANSNAMRNVRNMAKLYDAIADAFQQEDGRKLQSEMHEGHGDLQQDRNLGLAKQVLEQHRRNSVRRLGDLYACVPLNRVAKDFQSTATDMQAYLQDLIRGGHLQAVVEQGSNGTLLRFNQRQGAEARSEAHTRDELIRQTRKIAELAAHVAEADRMLGSTKEYLDYAYNKQKGIKGAEGQADEGFGGRPPSASDGSDDEQMMTDIS